MKNAVNKWHTHYCVVNNWKLMNMLKKLTKKWWQDPYSILRSLEMVSMVKEQHCALSSVTLISRMKRLLSGQC